MYLQQRIISVGKPDRQWSPLHQNYPIFDTSMQILAGWAGEVWPKNHNSYNRKILDILNIVPTISHAF